MTQSSRGVSDVLRRHTAFVVRHRTAVIAAVSLISLWLAVGIRYLHVEVDPDENLPQGHPAIQALNEMHDRFGDKNLVVVGVFPKDGRAFTPAFLATVDRLTKRIGEIPGSVRPLLQSVAAPSMKDVSPTEDGFSVTPLMPELPASQADADAVRSRVFADPTYAGTLAANDGSALAIYATFELTPELPAYEDLYAEVRRVVTAADDGSFEFALSGPVALSGAAGTEAATVVVFFPIALLLIGAVHFDAFRTLQAIFLPILTALLAVVWAMGLMGWLGVPIDPFSSMTPILILAIAAGHAVQILKRYYEEYARLRTTEAAVVEATADVGAVMLAAGAIAALSFLSLGTLGTATLATFGVFTALGILSTMAIELTMIPAVRASLSPGTREITLERSRHPWIDGFVAMLARAATPRGAGPTLVAASLLVVACALLALRIPVDTSLKRQFKDDAPIRAEDDRLNASFAGTNTLVFLVEGPDENAIARPDAIAGLLRFEREVEKLPGVGKAMSIADTVERLHRVLNADREVAPLPETQKLAVQYLFLYSMSGGDDLATRITPDNRIAKVVVLLRDDSTHYGAERIADAERLLGEHLPADFRYRVSGTLASNGALTETLVTGKIENIVQMTVLTLAVASILFRSVVAGLLVIVPLVMAVAINFGLMGALGIPLDMATATISAMAVGIGADYAVYFLSRFREELGREGDLDRALATTYDTSGKAVVFVSSAVALGYSTLCLSSFAAHVRLGGLVAVAMVSSAVATLTILPALLRRFPVPIGSWTDRPRGTTSAIPRPTS